MRKINILKLLIVLIVFLFAGYIYLPKTNKVIEYKILADININETMDYPFEIHWDDSDYENNRPESITYNLFNILDENTIVSTITLTSANVDSNDTNKWNGSFPNIKK